VRLLKTWFLLLAVCLVSGCKSGPKVTFCVLDSPAMVLRCADPDGRPFDMELAQADAYGCMSPADWQNLLRDVAKNPAVKTAAKEVVAKISNNSFIQKKYETVFREIK